MNRKNLLKHLVFLMFFIFVLDLVGVSLYWDYSTWWFDMVLHFFGGFWVGLFFIYVFYIRKQILKPFFHIIIFVLLIGILWELFEFYANNYIGKSPFDIIDTLSDIFFDLSGGLCAILYLWKKQPK